MPRFLLEEEKHEQVKLYLLMLYLIFMRLVVQPLELRVQFHELPRHPVDASVQVPVLTVLPVEVLLVALPLLGAANS